MNHARKRPPLKQRRTPPRTSYSARRLAFDVLTAWQQRGVFASRALDELSRKHAVSGSERALGMELSYGVIRRQATVDTVLKAYVDRPQSSIESGLWTLLRLGAYQILLMDGIPSHAAVNETVEVARQLRRPEWSGVINGVLRALSRGVLDADSTVPSVDRVPVDSQRWRQLDRPVFPSPDKARTEYFVKAHSYPRWLIRNWVNRYGEEETTRLCYWFNEPHPPTLRVNRLRQSPEVVREVLETAAISTEPGRWPESLRLQQSVRIDDLPGFAEGWFSIQDESSMAAARLLDPRPGESVLDLCAAPGGKTTHLAELMEDRGSILAIDIDPERIQRVEANVQRLKLTSIECRTIQEDGADLPNGPFDRVLVDVPCSNTGVLGKRPEARWRIDSEEFEELIALQKRLLRQALERVKPGGRVVYSTCSIDPRENRQVVEAVLSEREDVSIEQELDHHPGRPGDGGYQALLDRRGE